MRFAEQFSKYRSLRHIKIRNGHWSPDKVCSAEHFIDVLVEAILGGRQPAGMTPAVLMQRFPGGVEESNERSSSTVIRERHCLNRQK